MRRRLTKVRNRAARARNRAARATSRQRRSRWWKVLGVAGIVGVAATGAVLARDEQRRRAYSPEEIRARLHERLAAAPGTTEAPPEGSTPIRPVT